MKSIHAYLLGIALTFVSLCSSAQNDLSLNGMAAFEQLRKEYYIGALYLGWPGRDSAAIANMPGKKRMEIHVTADRWPALRYSQMWNQAITINNQSSFINANALDILAFTSLPKGDLVEGDRIAIELTGNNTTLVSINGIPALRTGSSALFTMLLNAWIGARPPSSEFKRDILDMPKGQAGTDLATRFDNIRPSDARKKTVAGWGFKVESEAPAAAVAAAAVTAPAAAQKAPEPAPVKPEPPKVAETKPAVDSKPVAEAKPIEPKAAEPKAAEPKTTEPKTTEPRPVAPPVAAIPEAPKAAPTPAPAPQPEAPAKVIDAQERQALYNQYVSDVRNRVVRNIEYPRRAAKEGIEGLVMLRIQVSPSGGLVAADIAQSADDALDAEALRAVKKAAPFPKASSALADGNFELVVPVVFKLTQ